MRKQKKMRRSSQSPSSSPPLPPPSFSSLPDDVVLNCLARTSRIHHRTLSLVSKTFRSLLASPGLEAARTLVGKPEKFLYVCLNLNSKPSWFMFSPALKQKLIPIPSLPNSPCQHPISSTVVSVGSEIYLIGGSVKGNKGRRRSSKRAFLLDCKSHQWRQLPNMLVSRKEPVVDVIDGKIYVVGGCSSKYINTEKYGEVYAPTPQTWEPIETELGKQIHRVKTGVGLCSTVCLIDSRRIIIELYKGKLRWRCDGSAVWFRVWGLEVGKLSTSCNLLSVTNPGGRSRVIVWWRTYSRKEWETKIWCAQILCLPGRSGFRGIVEWSQNVFTFQGCESSDPKFLLHDALVAHDH